MRVFPGFARVGLDDMRVFLCPKSWILRELLDEPGCRHKAHIPQNKGLGKISLAFLRLAYPAATGTSLALKKGRRGVPGSGVAG